mgnify:CR=1 FL=1
MEIRGIDVSAWQGKIDWKTVADYSMGFAILRITEAGNVIDSYFEQNFSECRKYNIPVGAYKYSYAMTVAEIQSEARKVVEVLNGRKLQYPVWLDLEWNNQRSLGAEQIHKLAEAFEKIITAAGYKIWYLLQCGLVPECNLQPSGKNMISGLHVIRHQITAPYRNDSGRTLVWAGSIPAKRRYQASADL